MVYLSNAFSLNMLAGNDFPVNIRVSEISEDTVREMLANYVSVIGHQSTAEILEQRLGVSVPMNRIPITLQKGDLLVVAQLIGRLPEGVILSAEEISKFPIKFFLVEIV